MSKGNEPVEEAAVRIEANGRLVAASTATPYRLDDLAAGRLLADGLVDAPADLSRASLSADGDVWTVRVALAGEAAERLEARLRHGSETGCGPRHFLDCEPERLGGGRVPPPDAATAAELLRAMYADAERFNFGGGVHVAALVDAGNRIVACAEDVGRHNAADRVIGAAWRAELDLSRFGLFLSSRVSGALAVKAGRARLAWIASRSVPTTLALRVAAVAGVPILARAAGAGARLFAP